MPSDLMKFKIKKSFSLFCIFFMSGFLYAGEYEEKIQIAYSMMNKDYKLSLEALYQVITEIQSDSSRKNVLYDAYIAQGVVYSNIHDYENAEGSFSKCIEIDDKIYEGFYYLGLVKNKLIKFDEALINLQKSLELKPDDQDIIEDIKALKKKMNELQ